MLGTVRIAVLAAATLFLSACGGGGGGDGGFLPDRGPAPLAITTESLPDVVALPYATVLEATGGEGAYRWRLVSDGGTSFTLDEGGVLRAEEAIPEGTYGLTFAVADGDGRSAEKSLTIVVAVQPLAISSTALPPAENGTPYSAILEAVGGSTPYEWRLVDDGDTGLDLSGAGVLSGDPPNVGTYGLTFALEDDAGTVTGRSLLLNVTGDEPQPLEITTTALPQASEGDRYAAVLAATGGSGDYSWRLTFDGGTGFSLTGDGILRGTTPAEGTYGLTVSVNDGTETRTRSLTVAINGDDSPLVVETTALPEGIVGTRYAAVVTATGGTGDYSWTLLDSGSSGLRLSSNGVLSGLPGLDGTFGITVRVSDGNDTAVRSFTVSFAPDATAEEPVPLAIATESLPSAEPGGRYATVLVAQGGSGNYNWTLLDDGQTGLTLDASGVLSGTAPAPGNYGLTFQVDDGQGTVSRSLTLSVIGEGPQALTIVTETLPAAISGTRYATVLGASGGTGAYTWSFSVDDGGTGLTLGSSGVLSGIAPAEGSYGLTVVVDDGEDTVSRSLTLEVSGAQQQPLQITTTSLPDAQSGALYAATLDAVGGAGPYDWALLEDGGTGFTLDSNGSLRGTAPAPGDYALTAQVSDGINVTTRSLTLTVTGDDVAPLSITTTALPAVETGSGYAAVLEASGGSGSYSWTLVQDGGSGLSLDSNGVFSGAAPAVGEYGLTVDVEDGRGTSARKSFVLTVTGAGAQPLQIITTSLPGVETGTGYAAVIEASGGDSGNYSWTLDEDGGSGLTLNGNVLQGTAPAPGSYGLTLSVDDGQAVDTQSYTLLVTASGEAPLTITTASLPTATVNLPYVAVLEAQGGTGSYSWTLVAAGGSGLSIDSDGILSGTVAAEGSYGLTFDVSDGSDTARRSLTLLVGDGGAEALTIVSDVLPGSEAGATYAATLQASGGTGSYSWSLVDGGGTGLTLDGNGVLRGTAPAAGNYALTVQVSDGSNSATRSLALSTTGQDEQPLSIVTGTLPAAEAGALYAAALNASGGSGSYTWSLVNDGGSGLTLDSNGVLRGTAPAQGSYGLTVEVTDGTDTASASLTLTVTGDVLDPLVISTTALPAVETGASYAAVLEATGGDGDYSWTLVQSGGTGLSLDSDGVFSGTAPAVGSYGITVSVSDGEGNVAQRSYVLQVTGVGAQPLQITTTSLPDAVAGNLYAAVLEAAGGDPAAYNWTLLNDGGSGLAISGNVLEGSVAAAGNYGVTVQVSDGQASVSASFVLTVSADGDEPLQITTTALPSASTDTPYVTVLEAQGGSGSYSWSLLSDGGLGTEISLDSDGILSGTITGEGSYGLTFEVDDGNVTRQRSLVLAVSAGGPQALTISTEVLPDATTTIYAAVLAAEGGVKPYSWNLVDDPNDSGLTVSTDGAISGTTPAPGVYALTVSVIDDVGTLVTRSLSLTVVGGPTPPVEIITDTLPAGGVGTYYATVIRASGGSGDYDWTLLGTVPTATGLVLEAATGVLTWPDSTIAAGTYTVTVQATDTEAPGSADTVDLTLTVNP
jgi:hypothetical protein